MGLKASLDYGTAIIGDVGQLDQYLYTYGKMIQAQWNSVLASVSADSEPLRVIDYGCGQGLAAIAISDRLGETFASTVVEVVLIEPSDVALVRAEAVYRNLFPTVRIVCLNKVLDDLEPDDFWESEVRTLHIFSNILDIPGFDIFPVFKLALTSGDHTVIAVSHNRDFAGGAGRLRAAEQKIKTRKWLEVRDSTINEFTCGEGGKFGAISWSADLRANR
jgi:SAM-dependent methyltransferase